MALPSPGTARSRNRCDMRRAPAVVGAHGPDQQPLGDKLREPGGGARRRGIGRSIVMSHRRRQPSVAASEPTSQVDRDGTPRRAQHSSTCPETETAPHSRGTANAATRGGRDYRPSAALARASMPGGERLASYVRDIGEARPNASTSESWQLSRFPSSTGCRETRPEPPGSAPARRRERTNAATRTTPCRPRPAWRARSAYQRPRFRL